MKYVIIQLNGTYRETAGQVPGLGGISREKELRLDHLIETVDRILGKKNIRKVLVVRGPEFSAPPFGALEELHHQITRLADSGRDVWYYASDYHMTDIYLSGPCSTKCIHPLGQVCFRGIARTGLFFRGLLDTYAIKAEVIRRGKYKSAADPFRVAAFDEFNREQIQRLLDGVVEHYIEGSSAGRKIPRTQLEAMLEGETFNAITGREKGLIDRICTAGEITREWKHSKVREGKIGKPKGRIGKGRKITAVLFHEGAIDEGRNRKSSLMGQVIGDECMVREIEKIRDNKKIHSVVFRISSGGGSAAASENILNALKDLSEKKPLVVSMGPVAGSGGYWIAGAGRRLFCTATTITGSIGVISIFFELQHLLASHGITTDTVKQGEFSDMGSSLHPLNDKERKLLETQIEEIYQEFITRTSQVRGISREKTEELAQGRVWIGSDACEKGLTDQLGTLLDAVQWIQAESGSTSSKVRFYPQIKTPFIQKLITPKPAAALDGILGMGQAAAECRDLHARALLLDINWYSGVNCIE